MVTATEAHIMRTACAVFTLFALAYGHAVHALGSWLLLAFWVFVPTSEDGAS